MLNVNAQPHLPQNKFIVSMARTESEVREAQRLRYKVFAEEMGARLPSAHEEIDRDVFDPYCEHLLVRDNNDNKVIGIYRILQPDQARTICGYYCFGMKLLDLVACHQPPFSYCRSPTCRAIMRISRNKLRSYSGVSP